MPNTPSAPEIIEACIDRRLEGVHVATPGTIQSYDSAKATATVRPSAPGIADLRDVPVTIPGAWSSGDPVLLVFCELEFGNDLADSGDDRRHGTGGAVAVPLIARPGQAVDFVALAALVNARLDAIQQKFDAHTHVVTTTGTATNQAGTAAAVIPIQAIGPLASVAAVKVKAR